MIWDYSLSRNFQTVPRRFDGLCLRDIGYVPYKSDTINRSFTTFNYSIILSGRGSCICGDARFPVTAPCVLTQLPGVPMLYGPPAGETWEELYFILPPEKFQPLEARGLLGENRKIWPIRNLPAVVRAIRALFPMIGNPDERTARVDLIDHLAERVIMETLMPGAETSDPASEAVAGLVQAMTAAPQRRFDFKEVAADYGVSYSTFQRCWREQHTEPPGQYQLSLRISECCRLLAETDMSIAAIGLQLGFDDPAYFSRIFRQRIGMPASEYRSIHRAGSGPA